MEIKKETRNLGIKEFRNLGFSKESESEERLILNYSLNKDYMGDLVILIGPNNAGKSNVLDAIIAWSTNTYADKRNISDTFMPTKMRNPLVELFTLVDDKRNLIKPSVNNVNEEKIELAKQETKKLENVIPQIDFDLTDFLPEDHGDVWSYTKTDGMSFCVATLNFAKDKFWELLKPEDLKKIPLNVYVTSSYSTFEDNKRLYDDYKQLLKIIMKFENEKENNQDVYKLIYQLAQNPNLKQFIMRYENWLNEYREKNKVTKKIAIGLESIKNDKINQKLKSTINLPVDLVKYVPNVIRYEEHHISNNDLICKADNLRKNTFFNGVLKMMGSDISELETTYQKFKNLDYRAVLTSEAKRLTKKLEKITKYFNDLYCLENDKYKFLIELNPTDISFQIFKVDKQNSDEDIPLFLDYQSTGFRWFFDLFFNVFATNQLHAGDIIIMDEPATNLHVSGQMELRGFLKDFAIKNAITFVIATHSPFMVNLDYLDEVRIISTHDQNIASIDNNFSVINQQDTDSLAPIRKSLTVNNNVFIDQDQIVVFVEGITDYNYLVGMKNWLGDKQYQQLTFLPIKGLGINKEDREKRLDLLKKIWHLNSVLLTDGDYAGQEVAQLNNDSMHPIHLISLNKLGFNEIEDLFSSEDQAKFRIKKEATNNKEDKWNKSMIQSATFKKILYKDALINKENNANHDETSILSKQTQTNFKKVFDEIIRMIRKPN